MPASRCQIAKSEPNISAQNSAHVTKPVLELWLRIVLTVEPKGEFLGHPLRTVEVGQLHD